MLDNLYRFPPGAEHHPALFYDRGSVGSAANVQVGSTWTNTRQIPFLLTSAAAQCLGGAAQYPVNWWIELRYPGTTTTAAVICGGELNSTLAAYNKRVGYPLAAPVLVPPQYTVNALALYNAGAAANTTTLHVGGFYIPRGNVAYP